MTTAQILFTTGHPCFNLRSLALLGHSFGSVAEAWPFAIIATPVNLLRSVSFNAKALYAGLCCPFTSRPLPQIDIILMGHVLDLWGRRDGMAFFWYLLPAWSH